MNERQAYDLQTLTTSAETAAVGELAYHDASGVPRFEAITPLLLDGEPAFSMTYASSGFADLLARSPYVSLVLSDSRIARVGWSPLSVAARARVEPDPEGYFFKEALMEQELTKHPPSRQLINSFMLQKENWWYLPRLIVRLEPLEEPRPVARRTGEDHGVLACGAGSVEPPRAETVAADDLRADRVRLRAMDGGAPPERDAPATLFFHDFEVPEMERTAALSLHGRLRKGALEVESRDGSAELGKRPNLIARWRSLRALERGCKRGLKEGNQSR